MRTATIAFIAALLGGFVGAWAWLQYFQQWQPGAPELRTRNLVLVDQAGKPAASPNFDRGQTVLRFYGSDSKPGIELGIDRNEGRDAEFLRFMPAAGGSALLNVLPNGDASLALGDNRWLGRVILGAYNNNDVPNGAPAGNRGLTLEQPGHPEPVFQARDGGSHDPPSGFLTLRRQDGAEWSIH